MNDISAALKQVYNSEAVVVVPGGGTFGMEAVARQFANDEKCLVLRNGWFSFRWSQILDMGGIASETVVMKAKQQSSETTAPFAPAAIEDVVAAIKAEKPAVVFAPHVETSAGIILPDNYIRKMAEAAHEVGAIMVLDCIASGCAWIDMNKLGVDVLISAPQKGWSASPSAGLVMLSKLAVERMENSTSDSFAIDLKKWHSIMQAYEGGGHAYHATMPTDSLRAFRDTMLETKEYGFDKLCVAQWDLGNKVRGLLKEKGMTSVAPDGFGAPGVVVSYTEDPSIQNGSKFTNLGMQIAAGVPLACDEPENFMTFRLGLFGLDKLYDVSGTIDRLRRVIDQVL
jgi:aspartate aminotransferase-like enzyme